MDGVESPVHHIQMLKAASVSDAEGYCDQAWLVGIETGLDVDSGP